MTCLNPKPLNPKPCIRIQACEAQAHRKLLQSTSAVALALQYQLLRSTSQIEYMYTYRYIHIYIHTYIYTYRLICMKIGSDRVKSPPQLPPNSKNNNITVKQNRQRSEPLLWVLACFSRAWSRCRHRAAFCLASSWRCRVWGLRFMKRALMDFAYSGWCSSKLL